MFKKLLLLSILSLFCFDAFTKTKFEIVIPTYNNERICIDNLKSVIQNYPKDHYHITVVNDCSTDLTGQLISKHVQDNQLEHLINVIHNDKRVGALANFYKIIHSLSPDTVVLTVDGDDLLTSPEVLNRVAHEYENNNVWTTYGQYICKSSRAAGLCREYPQHIKQNGSYRKHEWLASHLRTFKAKLFQEIALSDFLDEKGNFYQKTWDLAIMFPIMEMSGPGRIKFIPQHLYDYNDLNPISDWRTGVGEQNRLAHVIRAKPPYKQNPNMNFSENNRVNLVDLVVFTFNRPLQLYAFLESAAKYVKNLGKISVVCRADNEYWPAYEAVFNDFKEVEVLRQSNINPKGDFKILALKALNSGAAPHILFAVDDIICKDYVDCSECVNMLEKSKAYGFYLRLGKNLNFCYTLNQQQGIPSNLHSIPAGCYAWRFNVGTADWNYPNTVDMTLYKKEVIKPLLYALNYTSPNTLEGIWAGKANSSLIGLCYETSKIVNLPINLVQTDWNNRNEQLFSTKELLDIFNKGLKIDIAPFEKINNCSAHIGVSRQDIKFIPR